MAGLEWSRSKWGNIARWFLKFNEAIAARFAHSFITDNQGLSEYITAEYGRDSVLIPYGGDQFMRSKVNTNVYHEFTLPAQFDFAMALSLIHISEPTRRTPIAYAVFCLKKDVVSLKNSITHDRENKAKVGDDVILVF